MTTGSVLPIRVAAQLDPDGSKGLVEWRDGLGPADIIEGNGCLYYFVGGNSATTPPGPSFHSEDAPPYPDQGGALAHRLRPAGHWVVVSATGPYAGTHAGVTPVGGSNVVPDVGQMRLSGRRWHV